MELDTGVSLCALDNPVVAGMQGLFALNLVLCAVSALLLVLRTFRPGKALPPWCRAYSIAALSVHGFWIATPVLLVLAVAAEGHDSAISFLVSLEFLFFVGSSFIGLLLALQVRRRVEPEWVPALPLSPSSTLGEHDPAPRA